MNDNCDGETPVADASGEIIARLDADRAARCGAPEAVFALRKTPDETLAITRALVDKQGHALVTRADAGTIELLKKHFGGAIRVASHTGAAIAGTPPARRPGVGAVAVAAAGTSDLPVVEEAVFTLEWLGIEARVYCDIGVAGIHRLLNRLDELRAAEVVIVAAGMEGALPSVVAGLVGGVVIGVPTSVGYGAGLGGVAALLGMLSSCAPGVVVVNIDNGFGAAVAAAKMLGPGK